MPLDASGSDGEQIAQVLVATFKKKADFFRGNYDDCGMNGHIGDGYPDYPLVIIF